MDGSPDMWREWTADLHLHTVVSPCAEVEMIPPLIVRRARELGLNLLAVTDHNTAENAGAVMRAAQGTGIVVLPGMEVQTREEAHILALFDRLEQVLEWQRVVYQHLPPLKNREETFGAQFVVDETGDLLAVNDRLLLTATDLSLERVVAGIRSLGGLAIAAHVDRPSYSVLANLGFIPPDLPLDAIELSQRVEPGAWLAAHPGLERWPVVRSSDAHRLAEMRGGIRLQLSEPTVAGIREALQCGGSRLQWIDQ
jgi:hypothetical protein